MKRLLGSLFGRNVPDAAARAQDARRRGNAALAEGRLEEAARCYREALHALADDAPARVNLAYVLLEQSQPAAATGLLEEAVELRGTGDAQLPDAWFLLGRARQQLGARESAIAAYQEALRVQPAFPEALHALVPLLLAEGRNTEALQRAEALQTLWPSAEARVLIARAHYALANDTAALVALESVLQEQPDHPDALAGRGHARLRQGDYEGAAEDFEHALRRHGPDAERLVNLASACYRLGDVAQMRELVAQALELRPDDAAALNLRVVGLTDELRLVEAEAVARQALRSHPEDADLHWSLANALLLQGKLQEGWVEHRWRWRTSAMATSRPPARPEPEWRGEPLAGRTLLLVSEQGFGDTLQYLRYVAMVARSAARVLVQAPTPLQRLLADLPPNCELLRPSDPVRADCYCALMDLPHVFGTSLQDVPAPIPYLRADPAGAAAWAARVEDGSGRPRVGLAWSGNPAHTNDRRRSLPLARLAPLLRPDCRFFAVQPQVRASDEAAAASFGVLLEPARLLGDFADTAALLQALDLVVTVDTSVAHLAGALGRPVWILLPYCPDARWLVGRDDSPWYPTARLFRQRQPGDWDGVVREVHDALERLASGG